jgi:hypothetical protein
LSKVIVFPKRPDARPPSLATPMPPAWAMRHPDEYFDLDHWQISHRGNPFLRLDRFCITVFPARTGWKWCIASSADHEPLWSKEIHASERQARADAFDALVALIEREN